jgi:anti-sigma factor RsiW
MSTQLHPTEDLPAYALGALDDSERDEVETHVGTCTQCRGDLAQFQDTLYEAAAVGAVDVELPRDLRTRIVLRHRGAPGLGRPTWVEQVREFLARPIPLGVPAALVVLLIVAFGIIGATRGEVDAYARALAGVVDGRVVALAPSDANPDARASVVIPKQGQAYLVVRLPAPPSGRAWTAWVLKPGPVAIPAGATEAGGVFTLLLNAPLGAGDGVAITLEPIAGSAQPTTQPVLAVDRT